jgi:dTDP-4-dehydrorhamnose reductase
MKILITDIENNLGEYLNSSLAQNNTIFGFTKETLYLPDKSKALEIIAGIKPDVVIHTSSIENLELCEENESLAYTYNTIGSLNAAYPCSILDIPIVYFSTSYVYDGEKSTPYYETDDCYPVNVFGKTKLASEKLIRTLCKKYFIIRTSWIFGGSDCFVKNVLKNQTAEVFMCTKEVGNPTYIKDLSSSIEKIIHSDLFGIYNFANSGYVSKYDWVKYIFELANINKEIVALPEDIINEGIYRPKYTAMNTTLIKNCFDLELPNWKVTLKEYLDTLI